MSQGLILQADEHDDRLFFVRAGARHFISDARWLKQNGFRWPADVVRVPPSVLQAFTSGRPAALRYSHAEWLSPVRRSSLEMRAIAASQLRGKGVEFGAGASPFPVPLTCQVTYADMFATEELKNRLYPGQNPDDLVDVGLIADFDDMAGIEDESLDFIVACHVIEHTRDPIGALVEAHKKLLPGGSLVLVVPDKERTFDRLRPLTTLQHLIDDFAAPDEARDLEHFLEFYRLAFPVAEEEVRTVAEQKYAERYPIHFHVWDYASFSEMVGYVDAELVKWSRIWSQPTLSDPQHDIEFYFCLVK